MIAERFKFRRVNEITGTFLLIVTGVLVAAAIWTGHSQRWFKSKVALRIMLPADGAAGIRQGSEVYFLGTLVGSVADVIVEATGRMEAQVRIRRDFFRFVRADSSAVVKKKFGVAGDSFFEITRGTGRPLPEHDASINCNEQFQSALESAIEEIRKETLLVLRRTGAGLETWTKLGLELGESRLRVDQFMARLDQLAAGVEAGQGVAGKLLTDTALVDEARGLLARANEAMADWQGVATNLQSAVTSVRRGTTRLPEIADAVAGGATNLPRLVQQAQTSMRELERLIEAAQRHWLLRKYMSKPDPSPFGPPATNGDTASPASPAKGFRLPRDSRD